MKVRKVTIAEIEHVAHYLAQNFLGWNEPIPDFSTRFPNALESCVSAPFSSFGGKTLYKGLLGKASILFYLMVKNHPFKNGNKRTAMTALFYFLHKNKKWLEIDNQELYNFAKWVAESNPKLKNETVAAVQKFLKTYVVSL